MKKPILIKQRDFSDCGATCLASITEYYGLKVPISKIRQLASTDKKGTNVLGLIEAAKQLGLSAKGVKGGKDVLPNLPFPTIAHVIMSNGLHHYVVIYKATSQNVTVMDPAMGQLEVYTTEGFCEIWTGVLLLTMPNPDFKKGSQKVPLGSRLWFLLSPHKAIMVQALVGAALFTLIGLSTSIYIQKIIDYVLPSQNQNLLNLLSIGMIILLGMQITLGVLKSIFVLKTGQQIDARLILGYYQHLLTLPQQFFDNMRTGEIISRINDAVKIRVFINEVMIDLAVNIMVVIFSFCLMFTYYWKLALIMLLVLPFYGLIYWLTNYLNRKTERKVMEKIADVESQLVESLGSIRTIKAFGLYDIANLKTENRFVNLLSAIYLSSQNTIFSQSSSLFISRLFTIILLWQGSEFVIDQVITAGELMSFYAITGYFTNPASKLIVANKSYQNAKIAADRLFEIMDLEAQKPTDLINLTPEEVGDVKFENVHFRYGTRSTVFEGLSLRIQKGKLTAIVGESGSGKSTIASILKGLYPIEKGKVTIGSYDLGTISDESLTQIIGIVPQQVDLMVGTVLENISLGDFHPDVKRILGLAEQLGMLAFLEDLPNGLSTPLGEYGVNLSGGQRQRLAILRAIYLDPEVIIFDEATSALDVMSEKFVIETMLYLKNQGKTVITISHKLQSIQNADTIFVLDKGKLIQEGSHNTLLKDIEGKYRIFWDQQHGVATT